MIIFNIKGKFGSFHKKASILKLISLQFHPQEICFSFVHNGFLINIIKWGDKIHGKYIERDCSSKVVRICFESLAMKG